MKTMSCQQLGGACGQTFQGATFGEIAEQSKKHGIEMFQRGDAAHLQAMEKMQALMQDPAAMKEWFEEKKQLFEQMPEE